MENQLDKKKNGDVPTEDGTGNQIKQNRNKSIKDTIFTPARNTMIEKERLLTTTILFLPSGSSICTDLHHMCERLRTITNSYGYILYMIDPDIDKLFILSNEWRHFYANRFYWPMDGAQTIASFVANNKIPLIVRTNEPDIRYPKIQDIPTISASDILCVPILDSKNNCYGVIELYRENYLRYIKNDLNTVNFIVKWAGDALWQNEKAIFYKKYNSINMKLNLDLQYEFAKNEFDQTENYLQNVMDFTKFVLGSQSTTIYLQKDGVLHRELSSEDKLEYNHKDLRVHKEYEIANLALTDNIEEQIILDVFEDMRFDRETDIMCGRLIRSVVSTIFQRENNHKGILQIINKLDGDCFMKIDIFIMKLIRKFLGVWSQLENVNALMKQESFLNYDIFLNLITQQFHTTKELPVARGKLSVTPSFFSLAGRYQFDEPERITDLVIYTLQNMFESFFEMDNAISNFVRMIGKCYWNTRANLFIHAFESFRFVACFLKDYPKSYTRNEQIGMLFTSLCINVNSKDFDPDFFLNFKSFLYNNFRYHPNSMQNYIITEFFVKESKILSAIPMADQTDVLHVMLYLFTSQNYLELERAIEHLEKLYETREIHLREMEQRQQLATLVVAAGVFTKFYKGSEFLADPIMLHNWQLTTEGANKKSWDEFFQRIILRTFEVIRKYVPAFQDGYDKLKEQLY